MQTLWKLSQDGNSASRTLYNSAFESRLVSAIPEDELATALPADLPIPEQLLKAIEQAIEKHMDTVAQSKKYDNRDSCRLYAGYVNPFQAEAIAFGQWVSACWVASNQAQADIANGLRTIPTPKEAIAALPIMGWPV
jgi:hypothetical protein